MKVWDKRFKDREVIPILEEFNSSIKQDQFLYRAEIEASKAYAKALRKASILTNDELKKVLSGLETVKNRIEAGENLSKFEDIHSAIELLLTEEIGETGKKLHTGRSRNEQVVTDERLYLKKKIPQIINLLKKIQANVIKSAEENFDVVMPGYTHLQQAQCVLFSHYIMSLFWQLERDKDRLRDTLKRVDALSLGVGALAGSSISIDREYMKKVLGFSSVTENSMDTVSDRSFVIESLFAFSLILLDLGRFMEDLIIFSSQEFGYLEIDDCISTSSSLMPQKKNPDFFELIRASSGKVFGYLTSLFITIKGLPSTYNKDLQGDKIPIHNSANETIKTLEVFNYILNRIKPKKEEILDKMSPFLLSTDLVDYLIMKGLTFREAHGIVGEIVDYAQKENKELNLLRIDEFKNFCDLFNDDVYDVFSFENSIKKKRTYGSTNPKYVKIQMEKAKGLIGYSQKDRK